MRQCDDDQVVLAIASGRQTTGLHGFVQPRLPRTQPGLPRRGRISAFVGHVIADASESIDGGDVGTHVSREQARGDRKVLVVTRGERRTRLVCSGQRRVYHSVSGC